jgi:hypothetical protein
MAALAALFAAAVGFMAALVALFAASSIVLFTSKGIVLFSAVARVFFILSIRAIAKSILGPVTMHICELDNALSFKQSHAINLNINSEIPSPVAFFPKMLIVRRVGVTSLGN